MGFLRKDVNHSETLFLNIHVNRAADLVQKEQLELEGSHRRKKHLNPVLIAKFNSVTKKTKRKVSTTNPTWDQKLSLPLKNYDNGSLVNLSVWDKHRSFKSYLGELRINVAELFNSSSGFVPKTELKWYKLYSDSSHKVFVTGSLLLSFELVVKYKNKKPSEVVPEIKVDPAKTFSINDMSNKLNDMSLNDKNGSEIDLTIVKTSTDHLESRFKKWLDSLIYTDTKSNAVIVNDQGFYGDSGEVTDVSFSDVESDSVSQASRDDSSEPSQLLKNKLSLRNLSASGGNPNLSSVNPNMDNMSDDYSISDESFISASSISSFSDAYETDSSAIPGSDSASLKIPDRKKKKFKLKRRRHHNKHSLKALNFEIRNRKVDGVLFLEIVSCTDLPPVRTLKNVGRFDMDPFVVVTFGKKTFRTSWKRHSLNPIFNERLAFEILNHEKNFDVNFLVLDKDRFSLHDDVGSISIPLSDLTKNATALSSEMYLRPQDGVSTEFTDTETEGTGNSNITYVESNNLVESMEKKLIRKKKKIHYRDTSKFKTMDLSLKLANPKYEPKYSPKLKIRVRYETYDNLRRQFWKRLLEQYSLDETKEYDYIELISLLDTLGSNNSDVLVTNFFKFYGKSAWGGDTLTVSQICDCLEHHINSNSDDENKLFEIEKCPNCLKKRLNNKSDMDVVTHFAICGSQQWSIVDKLLVSSYVTPQLATKRWFTKVLIKISYGKYQLGSNSANILVQDRTTGIILEEKMGIYVRLGIRLLYKGFDSARKRRIRALMKKLSVKQGVKFDSPSSKADIQSFIKFHKLDLSDCLQPDPTQYPTFNEFFYRKLKAGARPVEAEHNKSIAVSPADCRCVAFESVTSATELWVKGKNFTLPKLFNGNFDNLEYTNVYKSDNCTLGIFRLAPQDYHRFHSPVDGVIKSIKFIDGEYYTVNPMAIRSELDVYGENIRSIISIETESFGTVIMVPVGAMMVGSTVLTKNIGDTVKRGEEVGYFKFGGSTVLLLFDKDKFQFDSDLINNSKSCIETLIRVGQSIGHSPDTKEFERSRISFSQLTKTSKQNLIRVITGGDLMNSDELSTWESEKLKLSTNEIDDIIKDEEEDSYDEDEDEEDEY